VKPARISRISVRDGPRSLDRHAATPRISIIVHSTVFRAKRRQRGADGWPARLRLDRRAAWRREHPEVFFYER
jgi:hypothetical protein